MIGKSITCLYSSYYRTIMKIIQAIFISLKLNIFFNILTRNGTDYLTVNGVLSKDRGLESTSANDHELRTILIQQM